MSTSAFIPDMLRLLADVSIVAPSSGQVLRNNGSLWTNATLSASDISDLPSALSALASLSTNNQWSNGRTQTFLNASEATTATIDGQTGIGQFAGLGNTPLNMANATGQLANARTTATSANTASAIVLRDGSGGFSTGSCIFTGLQAPILTSGGNGVPLSLMTRSFSVAGSMLDVATGVWSNSSGTGTGVNINPTDSTTGTGGITALKVNLAGTGTGSAAKLLIDAQFGGASKCYINSAGVMAFSGTSSAIQMANTGSALRSMLGWSANNQFCGSTFEQMTLSGVPLIFNVNNGEAARFTWTGSTRNFLIGTTTDDGVNKLKVAGSAAFSANLSLGTTTTTGTTTPVKISSGATYGTNTPGSAGNLKWVMFDENSAPSAYGIGMSAGLMEIRAGTSADTAFFCNTTELLRVKSNGNLGINTSAQFGSGVGVVGLANRTTAPTIAPIGGGVFYTEAGALKYMGSSGTITTLAAA